MKGPQWCYKMSETASPGALTPLAPPASAARNLGLLAQTTGRESLCMHSTHSRRTSCAIEAWLASTAAGVARKMPISQPPASASSFEALAAAQQGRLQQHLAEAQGQAAPVHQYQRRQAARWRLGTSLVQQLAWEQEGRQRTEAGLAAEGGRAASSSGGQRDCWAESGASQHGCTLG